MKNKITIIAMCLILSAYGAYSDNRPKESLQADTIEVKFGNKGKILIQVDSKEDLETLKNYDINSMLEEIEVPEQAEDGEEIIIEDEEGTKYLKESEDDEFSQLEEAFEDTDPAEEAEEADGKEDNYDRKRHRFSGSKSDFVSGLDIGINNWLQDGNYPTTADQYEVKPWGSWYIALMPTWQTHIAGKFALDYGAGFSWYNFKFQDPRTKLEEGPDGVIFTRWDAELQASKSKLTVAYLNAHLIPMFDFGYRTKKKIYDDGFVQKKTRYQRNGFRIGAGAYVGTRIGSYQKLVWRETGYKSKLREKDNFYLENLRYGIRGVIGYGEVDFFVNYDLSTMFAKDKGPELNAITFGLSF